MTPILLILQQYWKQIAGAALLIAVVIYLGGLHARVKVQAGKITQLEAELEAERIGRGSDREACAKIAQLLIEQDAAVNRLTASLQAASDRHAQAMAESVRREEISRSAAQINAREAAEAVAAAQSCEDKVAVFMDGLRLPE